MLPHVRTCPEGCVPELKILLSPCLLFPLPVVSISCFGLFDEMEYSYLRKPISGKVGNPRRVPGKGMADSKYCHYAEYSQGYLGFPRTSHLGFLVRFDRDEMERGVEWGFPKKRKKKKRNLINYLQWLGVCEIYIQISSAHLSMDSGKKARW